MKPFSAQLSLYNYCLIRNVIDTIMEKLCKISIIYFANSQLACIQKSL